MAKCDTIDKLKDISLKKGSNDYWKMSKIIGINDSKHIKANI